MTSLRGYIKTKKYWNDINQHWVTQLYGKLVNKFLILYLV